MKKKLFALSMAVILSCSGTIVMADDTMVPVQGTAEEVEKNSQLLFPIDENAVAGADTVTKEEYVEPEIFITNKDVSSLEHAVTSEIEKKNAQLERELDPMELTYDADSIIVGYKQENNSDSIEEMCKRDIVALGDEYAEELMGTEDRKIIVINLNDNKTVKTAIKEYKELDGVVFAEPNYVAYTDSINTDLKSDTKLNVDKSESMSETLASTPEYSTYSQWYLDRINAKVAWDFVKNCSHQKVRVCVLDTGCELNHIDLKKNLNLSLSREVTKYTSEYEGVLKGDGYYKGVKGNGEGHGTMVTGILGAAASNNLGIEGVASCYKDDVLDIVVVDVFEGYDSNSKREIAYVSTIIKGLNYALSINAKVVNMSFNIWGRTPDTISFLNMCNRLYNNGVVLVASAGNKNEDTFCMPSDFGSVISVMATDTRNNKASFSSYGADKDICAPGTGIVTTMGLDYTTDAEGTSFSASMVTGTVAMMLSVNPRLKPDQIKSLLYDTATDLGAAGKDSIFGNGLLNTGKAVKAASVYTTGVYPIKNENSISLGCTHVGGRGTTKFRWEYCVVGQNQWHLIADWNSSEWCTWFPDANENYVVVCRVSYFGDGVTTCRTDWTASRPQMTAKVNGTCVTPSGNGILLGCTANTSKYYTAVYIYSYSEKTWVASASTKGSSCWYQADGLPKGNYLAYFCTEETAHGRKLSCETFPFAVN